MVIGRLGQFQEVINLLRQVRWPVLLLIPLIQAGSYFANAKYYQAAFGILDYRVKTADLFELSLAVNFVNQIFPSGGFSGTTYLSNQLLGRVPVGKTTLVQVLRYFFTYLSFVAILAAAFLSLVWSGSIDRVAFRIILLISVAILVGSVAFLAIIRDRERLERLATAIASKLQVVIAWFKKSKKPKKINLARFFNDFYHGYELLLKNPKPWHRPLYFALLGNVAEVATVYVVFLSLGVVLNPGVVIVGYLVANIFSLLSLFAGGIGFYEASMVSIFVALGLPLSLSLSGVLIYRFLNFWLFLPFGFYFYRARLWRRK